MILFIFGLLSKRSISKIMLFRDKNTTARINQKLLDPKELRAFFQEFIDKGKNISYLISFYEELFYQNEPILVKTFQAFLDEKEEFEYSVLKEKVILKFNQNQRRTRTSNVCTLFKTAIEHLLNQKEIQNNLSKFNIFKQLIENSNEDEYLKNDYKDVTDVPKYDLNGTYMMKVGKNCHFYLQKENLQDHNTILNENEKNILTTDFKSNEYQSFIAHIDEKSANKNKILFPFLPNQTLSSFIQNANNNKEISLITSVDKFVIIKEIAIGLLQLHGNQIFHLNLCSSSIFINNDKDSYIFSFTYDAGQYGSETKRNQQFYYRHPSLVTNPHNLSYKENNINTNNFIKYDIYTFGVLIFEILTGKSPQSLINEDTFETKCERLKNGFGKILENRFCFKSNEFDEKKDFDGIQTIMKKCFDLKNPYSSMKNVLVDLDKLPIYQQFKKEINSRINNSKNIDTYKCTLSDLFINYYLVDDSTKTLIISFLNKCTEAKSINENENLLSQAINIFNLIDKCTEINDDEMLYNEQFNNFIQRYSLVFDLNKIGNPQLMSLSILINSNPSIDLDKIEQKDLQILELELNKYIKPIAPLSKFLDIIKENEMILLFAYKMAQEISYIHSLGLYHGSISIDSIGVYFNVEEKKFLPLIIPYYALWKYPKQQNGAIHIQCMQSTDSITEKQQKDVKKFIKLIKIIDVNQIISREKLKQNILTITNNLYNLCKFSKIQEFNYSSYQIKYSTIHNIFAGPLKYTKIWIIIRHFLILNKDENANLDVIVTNIFKFFIAETNLDQNFDDIENTTNKIEEMLKFIQKNNKNLINQKQNKLLYNSSKTRNDITDDKEKKIAKEKPVETFQSFEQSIPKIKNINKKVKNINEITRSFEIPIDIHLNTLHTYLENFLNSLSQNVKYKIIISSENDNIALNQIQDELRKLDVMYSIIVDDKIIFDFIIKKS